MKTTGITFSYLHIRPILRTLLGLKIQIHTSSSSGILWKAFLRYGQSLLS